MAATRSLAVVAAARFSAYVTPQTKLTTVRHARLVGDYLPTDPFRDCCGPTGQRPLKSWKASRQVPKKSRAGLKFDRTEAATDEHGWTRIVKVGKPLLLLAPPSQFSFSIRVYQCLSVADSFSYPCLSVAETLVRLRSCDFVEAPAEVLLLNPISGK